MEVVKVAKDEFFKKGRDIVVDEYKKAISSKGEFSIALSGGSTPFPLYALLAMEDIKWDKVKIFLVDERYLPLDDKDSNYGNLKKSLLDKIEIPKENVVYMPYLKTPEDSRKAYEEKVLKYLDVNKNFDLILLGMGNDGHTASLFADNKDATGTIVHAPEGEFHTYNRISLSMEVINNTPKKVFLLKEEKKEILEKVRSSKEYPASRVEGDVTFLLEI